MEKMSETETKEHIVNTKTAGTVGFCTIVFVMFGGIVAMGGWAAIKVMAFIGSILFLIIAGKCCECAMVRGHWPWQDPEDKEK